MEHVTLADILFIAALVFIGVPIVLGLIIGLLAGLTAPFRR